jgi:hypothetical protein
LGEFGRVISTNVTSRRSKREAQLVSLDPVPPRISQPCGVDEANVGITADRGQRQRIRAFANHAALKPKMLRDVCLGLETDLAQLLAVQCDCDSMAPIREALDDQLERTGWLRQVPCRND